MHAPIRASQSSVRKKFKLECWREILPYKHHQWKRDRQQPQELDHPLFNSNILCLKCQIISNKKEHMVLIKSIRFEIVLLWSPSYDKLLWESLPAFSCNALNAGYSHLVIAIVLLTHVHSSWNNAYQIRHISFYIHVECYLLIFKWFFMCRVSLILSINSAVIKL